MRRFLVVLILMAATLAPAVPASAANLFPGGCGAGSANGTPAVCNDVRGQSANNGTNDPIVHIITVAVQVIAYIIGIASVIGILAASLRMITSGGDSQAVASARSGVLYCLIGVAIAALAQVLVMFVLSKL